MRLKKYQVEALEALSKYLNFLSEAETQAAKAKAAIAALPEDMRASIPAPKDPVISAWDAARKDNVAASPDPWRELEGGVRRQIPHICLKLPTGGGKTLLAAHGLERISADYFKKTAGLVLWIVPSDAIYRQTKKLLTDRESPVRQVPDRISGGRVKILEKLDGFTRQDLEERLCVLLLMLPSANRETRESLKVFRDSGNYESLFPQDDRIACEALLKGVSNLELFDLAEAAQLEPEGSRLMRRMFSAGTWRSGRLSSGSRPASKLRAWAISATRSTRATARTPQAWRRKSASGKHFAARGLCCPVSCTAAARRIIVSSILKPTSCPRLIGTLFPGAMPRASVWRIPSAGIWRRLPCLP